jgi:hypothetical protein
VAQKLSGFMVLQTKFKLSLLAVRIMVEAVEVAVQTHLELLVVAKVVPAKAVHLGRLKQNGLAQISSAIHLTLEHP